MSLSRRELLKAQAAAVAAAAAGMTVPANAQPVQGGVGSLEIKWSKAPCRFCGTGCGVMVGVREGKVVATHGDTLAEVNRGLNCIKGYFLSKIMYGGDRLTTPLLRKKGGVFDKNGELTPVTWDEAFDRDGGARQRRAEGQGPTALGMFGSGQWTVYEGYAATKLMRAGFARTISIPMPATAWRRRRSPSCAPSAWTSRWAATTISRRRTRSCCGARTWPRCIRSCGRGSPIDA